MAAVNPAVAASAAHISVKQRACKLQLGQLNKAKALKFGANFTLIMFGNAYFVGPVSLGTLSCVKSHDFKNNS